MRRCSTRSRGVPESPRPSDELVAASAALADGGTADDRYSAALERFLALGGGDFEARARTVCADLGLSVDLDQSADTLSGGERARAALAAILLARYDLLLLDEPTNDLDLEGLERLERFLDAYEGALVVVSHDRELLDRAVTRIVEIVPETRRVREWAGTWSDYAAARDTERLAASAPLRAGEGASPQGHGAAREAKDRGAWAR